MGPPSANSGSFRFPPNFTCSQGGFPALLVILLEDAVCDSACGEHRAGLGFSGVTKTPGFSGVPGWPAPQWTGQRLHLWFVTLCKLATLPDFSSME